MQLNYNKSSWAILGFIRFLMAFIVLISHLPVFTALPGPLQLGISLVGKAAVVGFLIISGLSIGISYRRNSSGFFLRRFLRIYPLYFFAVLFTIVLQQFLGSPYEIPGQRMVAASAFTNIANFFFMQSFGVITITYNGPLWTLAVEVFFYLLTPLLFKLKSYVLIILIALSMVVYTFYGGAWFWGNAALQYAWPWLTGFLVAVKSESKWLSWGLMAVGVGVAYNRLVELGEPLSFVTVAVVPLMVFLVNNGRFMLSDTMLSVMNFLAELSYPLYLFHLPMYLLLHYLGVGNAYLYCGLLLILIIPMNYLLDHWLRRVFWKPLVMNRLRPGMNTNLQTS